MLLIHGFRLSALLSVKLCMQSGDRQVTLTVDEEQNKKSDHED